MESKTNREEANMKAIWFKTTKRGTRAYYWSTLALRAIPMKMADAEVAILDGTGRLYEGHPLGR